MPTRVKICCVLSRAEAELALRAGAHAVGLVSSMPSGPGQIPPEQIAEIAAWCPPGLATFLLTSATEPEEIAGQQAAAGAQVLQLCDHLSPRQRRALRGLLPPAVKLVQVVHVTGTESLDQAREAAEGSDALLLDSGRPQAAVKVLGGTGQTHDWGVSRQIREQIACPIFLAGGLNPGNVAQAIREVRPYGVDVCSGLRPQETLDPELLTAFLAAVAAA